MINLATAIPVDTVIQITNFLNSPNGQFLIRSVGVFMIAHFVIGAFIYDLLDEVVSTRTAKKKFRVKMYAGFLANVICGLAVTWLYDGYSEGFVKTSLPYILIAFGLHVGYELRKEKKRKERERNKPDEK